MSAGICLVRWMFSICICVAVAYTNHDDKLLSTGDIDTEINNEDRMDKPTVDDNLRSAARKRFYKTFPKPSSVDMQTLGDVRALVQTLGPNKDKFDERTLLPDKRAYMHDAFEMTLELLKANADTLETLTGDVKMMKSNVETRLDTLTDDVEMIKANTETRLETLTGDVKMIKSELMTKLDEYKTISDMQKANAEKLEILTKYVARHILYSSCLEYLNAGFTKSGEYQIYIPHTMNRLNVYCDQDTDDGGWLVFQRRQDGSVDFYRDWADYKAGFGELTGEFWLGNDHLHSLTQDQQELRVDLADFNGSTAYAKYSKFGVGSVSEKYVLTVNGFSGTAGDSLGVHNGMMFSTMDRDNDVHSGSCAQTHRKGAWWHNRCGYSNLNGIYYDTDKIDETGVFWYRWKNKWESLKITEMKMRPRQ